MRAGHFLESGNIDLDVEVAGIRHHRAILHPLEMLARENVFVPGDGDENVSDLRGLRHRHHAETVHHGFERTNGIHFGDDHVRAQALRAHRQAAPAPAVAGDDKFQSGEQKIRGAQNPVNGGLARAVAIIEEMLGQRVVHGDDRILQRAVQRHRAQSNHARGGFLGAADDSGDEIACAW